MGLDEAISALSDDDVSAEDFADRLESEHPKLYKEIYSDGFGAGKTSVKDDLDSTEEQLQSLQEERDQLQDQLEELKEEQPEAAEIRGKYEEKIESLQGKIEELQSTVDETKEEKRSAIKTERKTRFQQRLENQLQRQGVDPDYAEFKAEKVVNSNRVQFNDELEPEVFEEDGDIPTPGDGGPVEKLAGAVMDETPDKFVADDRPGSTGLGSAAGSSDAVTISREEARDADTYRQAKEKAEEQGKEVEIVD